MSVNSQTAPVSLHLVVAKPPHSALVPGDYGAARDYIVKLGLDADRHDPLRPLARFRDMAAEGYDLGRAPATMEMEALRSLGLFQEDITINRLHLETTLQPDATGRLVSMAQATLGGIFRKAAFLHADESMSGVVDAACKVLTKSLLKTADISDLPEVQSYHVDSFRANQNTAAPTRVTIGFSNGMTTQHVDTNVNTASFMALKAGFEMDLHRRRVTGMQPR